MYLSNKMYIFLFCYLTVSLSGMENGMEKREKVQPPCLIGEIYIAPGKIHRLYASQKYHDKLAQEITAINVKGESIKPISRIFIPVIPVNVFIKEISDNNQQPSWYDWTCQEESPTVSRLKQTTEDLSFPSYIPITWLHNAKTGTILSFTVHGFDTQLTCNSNVYRRNVKSFEEEFNIHVQGLQQNAPLYLAYDEEKKLFHRCRKQSKYVEPAFFEQRLLKQKEGRQTYEYGDKPFVSIEQLVIDLFSEIYQKEYQIILLLLKVKQHYLQMADISS